MIFIFTTIETSEGETVLSVQNECPYMHICSDLESDAKVGISKPRQGVGGLKRCT